MDLDSIMPCIICSTGHPFIELRDEYLKIKLKYYYLMGVDFIIIIPFQHFLYGLLGLVLPVRLSTVPISIKVIHTYLAGLSLCEYVHIMRLC